MKRKIFALLAGLGLPLLAFSAEHCLAMADAATGKWLVHEGVCDERDGKRIVFAQAGSASGMDERDNFLARLPQLVP